MKYLEDKKYNNKSNKQTIKKEKKKMILEIFSFAFTANAKRQAAACRKSKKIILF